MGIKEKIAGLGTRTLMVIAAFIVVASAATVAYLSNQVTVSATVQSPMQIILTDATPAFTGDANGVVFSSVHGNDKITVSATLNYLGNQPLPAGVTYTEVACTTGLFGANQLLYSDETGITDLPFSSCGTADGYDFYYLDGQPKEVGFSRDLTLSDTVAVNYIGDANCYVKAVMESAKRC